MSLSIDQQVSNWKSPTLMSEKLRLLSDFLEKHYQNKSYLIEVVKTTNVLNDELSDTRVVVRVGGHEYMNCDLAAFDKWIEREILV